MKHRKTGNGRSVRAGMVEALENRLLFAFGQTDTTFGNAGRFTVGFSNTNGYIIPSVQKILVDSSNRILGAGNTGMVRTSSTGVIDTTFGTKGVVTFAAGITFVSDAIDPTDGKIYVLTSTSDGTGLFRYTSDGTVDSSYGQSGAVSVTSSTSFTPQALAIQSNGDVLVAGVFNTDGGGGREVRVYRLQTDGTSDTSFGSSGEEEFNFGAGTSHDPDVWDNVSGMAVLSGGKILIGGATVDYAPDEKSVGSIATSYGEAQLAVARLGTNGQLDATYGTHGIALTAYATSDVINDTINSSGTSSNEQAISAIEQGAFAVRSDGSALDAATAEASVIEELTPTGSLKYETAATVGSQLASPLGIAILPDGRAVLLAVPPYEILVTFYEGFTFTYVSTTGVLGNVVYTTDNDPNTLDIWAATEMGALAVNSNGELLIGGNASVNGANSKDKFEVNEYKVGSASDPRPDDFPDATANSLTEDADGGWHFAYYDASTTHLMYDYRAPNGLWNPPVVVDSGADAGQYVSIGVTSKDEPGIAYFDGNDGDLKFAQYNGKKWTIQDLDSKGAVGLYPSLVYDLDDDPAITYYNKTKGTLSFAEQNAATGKWRYENVDASGDNVGRSSNLYENFANSRYSVAYVDNTTGSVMWAESGKGGGAWQTKVAAKTEGGADFLSMGYNDGYAPAISYYDTYAGDLKITYFSPTSQTFIIKTLATSSDQGLYTYLFDDPNPNSGSDPDVVSYSKSADKLTLFTGDTITGTPTATDLVTGGGKYLSAYFNYFSLDLAYFDPTINGIAVRPGPVLNVTY